MTVLLLAPVVVSLLVLAAHLLRAGATPLLFLVLAVLGLLGVRRPGAARVVQVVLVLGAVEWIRTLGQLLVGRLHMGEPVLRLVLILGAVALLTALSALVFRAQLLRARYGLGAHRMTDGRPPAEHSAPSGS